MKKLLIIPFLLITTLAFAQPKTVTITFTDEKGEVIAEQTLNEAETKSAQTAMISIPDWTLNAIQNRARIAQDKVVTKSGQGSHATKKLKKDQIVNVLRKKGKLKTAREKALEEQNKTLTTIGNKLKKLENRLTK